MSKKRATLYSNARFTLPLFLIALAIIALLWVWDASPAAAESASITVFQNVLGRTTEHIGATEGGFFDIDDLTDCGINTYRIWIGMSDVEYCDDDDPRGYIWGCDQAGNANYGTPVSSSIKADPSLVNWAAWDTHVNDPAYRWRTAGNPDTAFGDMVALLHDHGILPVLTLRNRDEYNWPNWAPNPPVTTQDWNEWWEYCFAVAYWFNVRNNYHVTHFQVHNEPDLPAQGWGGTEAQYAQLVKVAHDAIKTANDMAGIDTVMMAPVESQMPFPRTYFYFDQAFDAADEWIALADMHWYHLNGTYPLSDLEAAIDDVNSQIANHNPDGMIEPLWVSEFGNFSANAYDNLPEALRTAKQLLIFSRKGVQGVHLFVFYDWGTVPGLVKADGSQTESYYAYRLMTRGLVGAKQRLLHLAAGFGGETETMVTGDSNYIYLIVLRDGVGESATVQVDLSDLGRGTDTVTVWEYSSTHKDDVVATPSMINSKFSFTAPADGIALVRIDRRTLVPAVGGTDYSLAGGWSWVTLASAGLALVALCAGTLLVCRRNS